MKYYDYPKLFVLALPVAIFFVTFFIVPMIQLVIIGGSGEIGESSYLSIINKPRHFESLLATLILSIAVTITALIISTATGLFLVRNFFPGREILLSILTFPLAFPGVVIGFLIIMLAGRQGLIGWITKALYGDKIVFAYSMLGLFFGYLYFSIPRVILTIMAAAEKLDKSLGASPYRIIMDIIIPALKPGLIASGAICFATSMGAFGTAFTLATNIDVLPMTIYTEFTLNANIAGAASLSIVLGLVTWVALFIARSLSGQTVAVSG